MANIAALYSVRTLVIFDDENGRAFEERIILVTATSWTSAYEMAHASNIEYALNVNGRALAFFQAYKIWELEPRSVQVEEPVEIFSLIRESDLAIDAYISQFFDTGSECQRLDLSD